MILLIYPATVQKDRHQISPYLMPVRYLKVLRFMPKGARKTGLPAGDITTDEKSYHIRVNSSKDYSQICIRTDNVPKAPPEAMG